MEIAPVNFELRSPLEQEEIISAFSASIRTMPKCVHLKVVSTPANIEPFIENLRKKRSDEDNEGCRELLNDQILLIKTRSLMQSVSRRFFLSFAYEQDSENVRRPDFETISRSLHRTEKNIAASLEACGNSVISTDDEDYIKSVLYMVMARESAGEKAYKAKKEQVTDDYLEHYGYSVKESLIPVSDFISPERLDFSISHKYLLANNSFTAYSFVPSSAYPTRAVGGWAQVLFSGFEGVDADIWIKKEDGAKIMQRLTFALKTNWIRRRHTEDIAENAEALDSSLGSGMYIKSALSRGDDFCYMSVLLTVTAESADELKKRCRELSDHLKRNDLSMKRCLFQQREAYLSAIPLASYDKKIFSKSKRNIMGSHAGSCYPFTAYELCDEGGIYFGINPRHGSPVFLNIFDRTKYSNANMLILGPTGSGKTYTLLTMLLRQRQTGLQIYAIAPFKGMEFMRACSAVGGEFVRIAPGSAQNINIMEIRKHDTSAVIIDGEIAASGSVLTAKIQQIERFFSLLLKDITVQESHILDDALIETYKSFGITVKNSSLTDPGNPEIYKPMPVLKDLYEELQRRGERAVRLVEALSRYVTGSARSFSSPTNVNLENKFVVLDVSEMTNEMLPVGMFIALDFVLDAAKADRTKNKVIAIDEMWRLMAASPLTAEFTVEVFKIIRGYGGAAVGATQDLDDVLSDKSGAAIINNAKFKFFLPMERKEAEALASVVDITSEEMKQMKVSRAVRPGSDRKMLLLAGSNHVFVSLQASQKEHDLITTNADDLARIARQRQEENDEIY